MLPSFLTQIASAILAPFLILASTFVATPQESIGAALPQAAAGFETSLAAPITSSATSLTLAANAVRGGGTLSGFNCFTIDEGSSQAEYVCGTVSGTSVTGLTRGVSPSTGTSTIASLQFSHRRGASVKITDFPLLQIIKSQAAGSEVYDAPLVYNSSLATTTIAANRSNFASVGLVQDIAFNGAAVISANTSSRGVVELATNIEVSSSTANGGSGPLVIPASLATSTYNAATAGRVIPVTNATGTIDERFIGSTSTIPRTYFATSTFTGNVLFNFPVAFISSTTVASPTASTTLYSGTIPANVLQAGTGAIRAKVYFRILSTNPGGETQFLSFYYGGQVINNGITISSANTGVPGYIDGVAEVIVAATSSTQSQAATLSTSIATSTLNPFGFQLSTDSPGSGVYQKQLTVNANASQTFLVEARATAAQVVLQVRFGTIEIIR